MRIIAALFMEDIQLRPVPGPSTRIDLSGVQFSAPAPSPTPVTIAPHLVVLVWNPPGGGDTAALEVVFTPGADPEPGDVEPLARNVQPLQIEPGKFNYRLVRADLRLERYGTVMARCRIDDGPYHLVPYTLLPPVDRSDEL
jgi:hypothetical protein